MHVEDPLSTIFGKLTEIDEEPNALADDRTVKALARAGGIGPGSAGEDDERGQRVLDVW